MADKRAYFKLDVGYFTNPKIAGILAESPTAVILHIESIAYAAQHLTDGLVPQSLVMRLVGAEDSDAQLLLDAEVWVKVKAPGQIAVRDYLEHQRSAAEAKALSEAGRKAAASRWQSDSDADGTADGNADRMRNPMPREKEREREKNTAADAAFETFWAAYPKKIGKGQAVKAWRSASKRANTAAILSGLDAARATWAAARTETKFIPNPSTWLNGDRWADEIAPSAPTDGEWVAPPPKDWDLIRAAAQAEKRANG